MPTDGIALPQCGLAPMPVLTLTSQGNSPAEQFSLALFVAHPAQVLHVLVGAAIQTCRQHCREPSPVKHIPDTVHTHAKGCCSYVQSRQSPFHFPYSPQPSRSSPLAPLV